MVWYETKGIWKVEHDKLILTDSVISFKNDMSKTSKVKRTTIFIIDRKKLNFYSQYCKPEKPEYRAAKPIFGNFGLKE